MFGQKQKNEVDSLVGISARIEGDLCFTGGLRIDGEVHGNVIAAEGSENMLLISEHARVEGEVRCANLIVNGYISGHVYSSGMLELQPKGRIVGDVHYKTLEMHGGAHVTGLLSHEASPDEPVFQLSPEKASSARKAPTVYNEPIVYK
jgi:cytoskeletal protein CcmA (bactofilin family)